MKNYGSELVMYCKPTLVLTDLEVGKKRPRSGNGKLTIIHPTSSTQIWGALNYSKRAIGRTTSKATKMQENVHLMQMHITIGIS